MNSCHLVQPDGDKNLLGSLKELPQTTGIIVTAFRAKNSLANMILTAFFESETTSQFNEPVIFTIICYWFTGTHSFSC